MINSNINKKIIKKVNKEIQKNKDVKDTQKLVKIEASQKKDHDKVLSHIVGNKSHSDKQKLDKIEGDQKNYYNKVLSSINVIKEKQDNKKLDELEVSQKGNAKSLFGQIVDIKTTKDKINLDEIEHQQKKHAVLVNKQIIDKKSKEHEYVEKVTQGHKKYLNSPTKNLKDGVKQEVTKPLPTNGVHQIDDISITVITPDKVTMTDETSNFSLSNYDTSQPSVRKLNLEEEKYPQLHDTSRRSRGERLIRRSPSKC